MTDQLVSEDPQGAAAGVLLTPDDAAEVVRLLSLLLTSRIAGSDADGLSDAHRQPGRVTFPGEGDEIMNAARKTYLARRKRRRFFDPQLLGEPGWDILLSLYVRGRWVHDRTADITTSKIIEDAHLPFATGLRWLQQLETRGLVRRTPSVSDKRVVAVELTQEAIRSLNRYFAHLIAAGLAR